MLASHATFGRKEGVLTYFSYLFHSFFKKAHQMNRILTLLIILFAASSMLSAQQHLSKADSVVYSKNNQRLTFYSDSTYRYVLYPCDICPRLPPGNMQSFGSYQKDEQNYYLFSDESLSATSLPIVSPPIAHDNKQCLLYLYPTHGNINRLYTTSLLRLGFC